VLSYALSLVGTVGIFLLSEATGGLPRRFPDEILRIMAFAEDHTESSVDCAYDEERGLAASSCTIGSAGAEPTWLVYGDSHAWAARTVFDVWLKQRGESGRFVFRNSCPPLTGLHLFGDQGTCNRFNAEAAALVLESESLENVLLVSTWRQAIESRLSNSPFEMISREEGMDLFARQFSETVFRYSKEGRRVHVWEPVPGAKGNVPRALARAMLRGQPDLGESLSVSTQNYRATYAFFFDVVEENRQWITRTYSPASLLCDPHLCAAMLDGKPAYFDGSHITKSLYEHWVGMMAAADRNAIGEARSDRRSIERVEP
jgi:hypothetical protein